MDHSQTGKALRPRKTPRQSRATDTVAAIVEGAAHILERDGFAGYTTNAIAERAGVSIGSLYQYFPSKDAITTALIERELITLVDDVRAAVAIADPTTALRALIAAAVRHQRRRPTLARLLDLEEARLAAVLPRFGAVDAARSEIAAFLVRAYAVPTARAPSTAADIIVISRALTDASSSRSTVDAIDDDALAKALEGAVAGYLRAVTT